MTSTTDPLAFCSRWTVVRFSFHILIPCPGCRFYRYLKINKGANSITGTLWTFTELLIEWKCVEVGRGKVVYYRSFSKTIQSFWKVRNFWETAPFSWRTLPLATSQRFFSASDSRWLHLESVKVPKIFQKTLNFRVFRGPKSNFDEPYFKFG